MLNRPGPFLLAALNGAILLMMSPATWAKPDSAQVMRVDQTAARYKDVPQRVNIKIAFDATRGVDVTRLLVCGDSEPDAGEECDDGNTVSGDGCSATCTIEPGFDCSAAVAGQLNTNLLPNGSFEDGVAPWTHVGTPFPPISTPFDCAGCDLSVEQDGGGWYWAGGSGSPASQTAMQSLVIPTTATTLTFNVWEAFCVPNGGTGDFVSVAIDGAEVYNSGVCTTEGFYAQSIAIDLSTATGGPYNDGSAHTISVVSSMDFTAGDSQAGSITLDNFAVNEPRDLPIPPIPSMCTAVVCGDGAFPQFSAAGSEECDDGNTAGGDGCSASCSIEQPNFFCDDPLPPAASGEDVTDGGLEDGFPNANWIETGTVFEPICSQLLCGQAAAQDGAFFAWFGAVSEPNVQTLTQEVVISSTSTDLTFDLLVGVCDSASDSLTVEIDATEVWRYDCTTDNEEYTPQSIALGGFADGGSHTVSFLGNTVATNGGNSNFFVDNISIADNVAFAGLPGSCFELPTACDRIEEFTGGIPLDWTVVNFGVDDTDGWGASTDGICASQNWSTTAPSNNVTGGADGAACADSDATGQIDIDGAEAPLEMDTYLCSPALNLSQVTDPQFSFRVNYQAFSNALNDNGTPKDPSDDFDEDFLRVLVGTAPPNLLTVPNYTSLGNVFDHLDSTLALSEDAVLRANLTAQNAATAAHVCFHYRGTYAWFAQIDNAGLRGSACVAPPDSDTDGVPDVIDNCLNIPNTDQRDTDGDGHGNRCDADFNNDCIVNPADLGLMRLNFFVVGDTDFDLNGDGVSNPADLGIFRTLFFQPPGESNVGTLGCAPGP